MTKESKNPSWDMDAVTYGKTADETLANRNYKDRLFRLVFEKEEALLELYNALNGTDYTDSSELVITTIDNVLYMNMKNDVSFLVAKTLNMYEHQSTKNPNIPLRDLFYLAAQYRKMVEEKRLYSSRPVELPTPICIMFYNGNDQYEDVTELCLSDLYTHKKSEASLELVVRVYNINYGHNKKLMEACRNLEEYAIFIDRVKRYLMEHKEFYKETDYKVHLTYAINRAIEECIRDGVLTKLLKERRDEVKEIMFSEYDEEAVLKMIGEEKYEDGFEDGKKEGKEEGKEEGIQQILITLVKKMYKKDMNISDIAEMLELEEEKVEEIIKGIETE